MTKTRICKHTAYVKFNYVPEGFWETNSERNFLSLSSSWNNFIFILSPLEIELEKK